MPWNHIKTNDVVFQRNHDAVDSHLNINIGNDHFEQKNCLNVLIIS